MVSPRMGQVKANADDSVHRQSGKNNRGGLVQMNLDARTSAVILRKEYILIFVDFGGKPRNGNR